jgi:hypothetical protein
MQEEVLLSPEERQIFKMNATLGDLKRMLQPATSLLDDVEQLFLAPDVLRNPAEWHYWLGNAERVLKRAIEQRAHVQRLAKKFGPDARLI